jgi:hypothetical protein
MRFCHMTGEIQTDAGRMGGNTWPPPAPSGKTLPSLPLTH